MKKIEKLDVINIINGFIAYAFSDGNISLEVLKERDWQFIVDEKKCLVGACIKEKTDCDYVSVIYKGQSQAVHIPFAEFVELCDAQARKAGLM